MPPHKIEKEVDFMEYEVGKPHWLSPQGRFPEVALRARAKYRKIAEAQRQIDRQFKKIELLERRLKEIEK